MLANGCAPSKVWDDEVGACRQPIDLPAREAELRARSGLPSPDIAEAALLGMLADGTDCAVQAVCGWTVASCKVDSTCNLAPRSYAAFFDERLALRGTVTIAGGDADFSCRGPIDPTYHLIAGELPPCWSILPGCIEGWPNCGAPP